MNINDRLFFILYNAAQHLPAIRAVAVFVANYLDIIVGVTAVAVLFLILIWNHDDRSVRRGAWFREVAAVAMSVGLAWFVTFVLKSLFRAPRPFVVFLHVRPLIFETPYTSFPSGHATLFFALATVILYYHKKLGYVFFAAAVVISLARVFVSVHFPGDILAGAVIGTAVAALVHRAIRKRVA